MSALKPQDTRALARGAIIAALYTALTVLLAPLSYGEVQIRFSEAFTLLPVLMPEAVPALLVGCLLANILGGCTIFDIVFGSLATLLAALCTRRLREKFWLAALMPVLFNGVIVGAVVHFCYSPAIALPLCMLSVAAGEAVGADLSFAVRQAGMFSFTGLNAEQMLALREKYGVYGVANGRICIAGLNTENVTYVAKAIAGVR